MTGICILNTFALYSSDSTSRDLSRKLIIGQKYKDLHTGIDVPLYPQMAIPQKQPPQDS